ncbi:MAG TPA: NAD(P)-binding protein [Steroidobacteraceae bacterium]|nr:NAD(P)-binding protein [Steroidobacteraceae bacterium]
MTMIGNGTAKALDTSKYPRLFGRFEQGRLQLRNRIVHASMTTRRVKACAATPEMIQYYANRARGGAALVVTEPLSMAHHQNLAHKVRVWTGENDEALRRWAEAVESEDCRLLGQIQDSGRGRHERGRNPDAVGVSALPDDLSWTVPHVLTIDDIERMIDEFATSSQRLEHCGFSGVEISAGHGHLFHQFMSPWSNLREDAYGGDLGGRLRFVRELIAAIRARTGSGFLIGLKLPGDDGIAGGIGPADAAVIARSLTQSGAVDYVAFCQGAHARTLDWHIPDMHWPRATWMPLIRELRQSLPDVPVLALGLITDPAEAEGLLERDEADLVAIGRALVTDPAWPLKSSQGREAEIRYCVSCNTCWGQIVDHHPLACDNNPRVALPDEVDWWPAPASTRRRIVVVGAGIAGMEAAWIAGARGHDVTVFGATAEVGGKTRLHARLPGGESLSSIYDYQYLAARKAGIRFELGVRATLADIEAARPDLVVLAAGATMLWPRSLPAEWREEELIPDLRALMVDLLDITQPQGGTAVIFDQDHTEGTYAAAEFIARLYERVVLVTPRERIAVDVPLVTSLGIYRRLTRLGIEIVPLSELAAESRLEEAVVSCRNVYTGDVREIEDVSLLTYSTPRAAEDALAGACRARGFEVRTIGDCHAPRTVLAATSEGHALGNAI